MSIGTPLLTNRTVEGIDDLFAEGEHYIGYEGEDEMASMARWALGHPDDAEDIATSAHALVRREHTYADRARRIIEEMSHV